VETSSTRFDDAGEFESDAFEASEHDEDDPWVELSAPELARLEGEHQRCVDNCLPKLSGAQREILVMLTYAGQTLGDVAKATGESLGTIKSRQHYALEKMKQCVQRLLQSKSGASK
jgi:RNA polymerase sigma factor (sigma-70 family)